MNKIKALLLADLHAVAPNTLLGKALHYAEGQWLKLERFASNGTYPIDNNACENSIRRFALGRSNYLFMGSDAGGDRAAAIYSLVETAKLNGMDPEAYLREVLSRIAESCRGTFGASSNGGRPDVATRLRRIKAPAGILQVHIELRGLDPKVWRRVLVPQTITLAKLHLVIQATFGWGHAHLHEFLAQDGQRYGTSDPDYDAPGEVASERTRLTTVLRTSRTLTYLYDFGDDWNHRINLERTFAPDPHITLPFCIGGASATPPEDCGGAPGYEDFVRVMNDPRDSEHADTVRWSGVDTWDPAAFDSIQTNDLLAEIKL